MYANFVIFWAYRAVAFMLGEPGRKAPDASTTTRSSKPSRNCIRASGVPMVLAVFINNCGQKGCRAVSGGSPG
jgi:hypothetical protein